MGEGFRALCLSFKTTPVKVREQLAMNEISSKQLMAFMKDYDCTELLVISTCNRTEFYFNAEDAAEKALVEGISLVNNIDKQAFLPYLRCFTEPEAVSHLFRVSIGLESQVVGDLQIINQVKRSYQWSADEAMAGPYLHRLMHTIFYTNKRVVQETIFRDGAASISYVAKELAEDLTKDFHSPKILLLGLGEIGLDVARNLSGHARAQIYIANRTRSKAEAIASEFNYSLVEWDDYLSFINEADVIISSVAAPQPIITKNLLQNFQILTHKFFIDLSVPRSIVQDVEQILGAIVYNIDEIQNKASETLQKRLEAVPKVECIVYEAIEDFHNWSREMIVSPTIKKLKNALEQIRQEQLARYVKTADTKDAKLLDKLSKSMVQKVMKLHVLQLKAACQRGEANKIMDILHDLFDLEKEYLKD